MLDQSDSLCQCALPRPGQGAPLWPQEQVHYREDILVPGYPIVKRQGSVCGPLPSNKPLILNLDTPPSITTTTNVQETQCSPVLSLRKAIIGEMRSGQMLRILHTSALHCLLPSGTPPHLLVSRSTVMLGIGHMVCAENARAGIALERQKICRDSRIAGPSTGTWLPFPLKDATWKGKHTPSTALPSTHSLATPTSHRPQLLGPPSSAFPARKPTLLAGSETQTPCLPAQHRTRSASHPGADSSARNSEPRGPETPSLGQIGVLGKEISPESP